VGAIAERYEAVRRQVVDAADVTVVAVTKTVGVEEIRRAIVAGCRDFGENRMQEFTGKRALFPDVRWHFIGTLQTNKVKDVVGKAYLIHSVDSVKLLQGIDRHAQAVGCVQPVLLQINISAEASKHGLAPHDAAEVLQAASALPSVSVRGLMTMAPLSRPEDVRWVFRDLAQLEVRLQSQHFRGVELRELSMGMTNDFRVAVEEGSTIVRVGRAIFGK
jgi:pyridoxal phosphate enzyme (YggS family)